MKDPPIPRSGKCVVCSKARPRVALLNADPFCSSPCARKWHGTVLGASWSTSGVTSGKAA